MRRGIGGLYMTMREAHTEEQEPGVADSTWGNAKQRKQMKREEQRQMRCSRRTPQCLPP